MTLTTYRCVWAFVLCCISVESLSTRAECPEQCDCLPLPSGGVAVDCSRRDLTEIPADLPLETEALDLSGNAVLRLGGKALITLSKLKTVDLEGVPLHCQCSPVIAFLYSLEAVRNGSVAAHCSSGATAIGRPLHDLDISQAGCTGVEWTENLLAESISLQAGAELSLSCSATGRPAPRITWLLNGRSITIEDNVIVRGDTLRVLSALPSNSGRYTCRASNWLSTRVQSTDVRVSDPNVDSLAKSISRLTANVQQANDRVSALENRLSETNEKLFQAINRILAQQQATKEAQNGAAGSPADRLGTVAPQQGRDVLKTAVGNLSQKINKNLRAASASSTADRLLIKDRLTALEKVQREHAQRLDKLESSSTETQREHVLSRTAGTQAQTAIAPAAAQTRPINLTARVESIEQYLWAGRDEKPSTDIPTQLDDINQQLQSVQSNAITEAGVQRIAQREAVLQAVRTTLTVNRLSSELRHRMNRIESRFSTLQASSRNNSTTVDSKELTDLKEKVRELTEGQLSVGDVNSAVARFVVPLGQEFNTFSSALRKRVDGLSLQISDALDDTTRQTIHLLRLEQMLNETRETMHAGNTVQPTKNVMDAREIQRAVEDLSAQVQKLKNSTMTEGQVQSAIRRIVFPSLASITQQVNSLSSNLNRKIAALNATRSASKTTAAPSVPFNTLRLLELHLINVSFELAELQSSVPLRSQVKEIAEQAATDHSTMQLDTIRSILLQNLTYLSDRLAAIETQQATSTTASTSSGLSEAEVQRIVLESLVRFISPISRQLNSLQLRLNRNVSMLEKAINSLGGNGNVLQVSARIAKIESRLDNLPTVGDSRQLNRLEEQLRIVNASTLTPEQVRQIIAPLISQANMLADYQRSVQQNSSLPLSQMTANTAVITQLVQAVRNASSSTRKIREMTVQLDTIRSILLRNLTYLSDRLSVIENQQATSTSSRTGDAQVQRVVLESLVRFISPISRQLNSLQLRVIRNVSMLEKAINNLEGNGDTSQVSMKIDRIESRLDNLPAVGNSAQLNRLEEQIQAINASTLTLQQVHQIAVSVIQPLIEQSNSSSDLTGQVHSLRTALTALKNENIEQSEQIMQLLGQLSQTPAVPSTAAPGAPTLIASPGRLRSLEQAVAVLGSRLSALENTAMTETRVQSTTTRIVFPLLAGVTRQLNSISGNLRRQMNRLNASIQSSSTRSGDGVTQLTTTLELLEMQMLSFGERLNQLQTVTLNRSQVEAIAERSAAEVVLSIPMDIRNISLKVQNLSPVLPRSREGSENQLLLDKLEELEGAIGRLEPRLQFVERFSDRGPEIDRRLFNLSAQVSTFLTELGKQQTDQAIEIAQLTQKLVNLSSTAFLSQTNELEKFQHSIQQNSSLPVDQLATNIESLLLVTMRNLTGLGERIAKLENRSSTAMPAPVNIRRIASQLLSINGEVNSLQQRLQDNVTSLTTSLDILTTGLNAVSDNLFALQDGLRSAQSPTQDGIVQNFDQVLRLEMLLRNLSIAVAALEESSLSQAQALVLIRSNVLGFVNPLNTQVNRISTDLRRRIGVVQANVEDIRSQQLDEQYVVRAVRQSEARVRNAVNSVNQSVADNRNLGIRNSRRITTILRRIGDPAPGQSVSPITTQLSSLQSLTRTLLSSIATSTNALSRNVAKVEQQLDESRKAINQQLDNEVEKLEVSIGNSSTRLQELWTKKNKEVGQELSDMFEIISDNKARLQHDMSSQLERALQVVRIERQGALESLSRCPGVVRWITSTSQLMSINLPALVSDGVILGKTSFLSMRSNATVELSWTATVRIDGGNGIGTCAHLQLLIDDGTCLQMEASTGILSPAIMHGFCRLPPHSETASHSIQLQASHCTLSGGQISGSIRNAQLLVKELC